jgi:cyclomaltodextrinase / maltogenic alpha-amylase / neopullulanase
VNEPQTPDWVRDAIFYQIFPDRFARSLMVPKPAHLDEWGATPTYHGYQGGDLIGVVERLDYLVELGINAIYFTPIFQSASNHRYHTHDYEKVDPMLGGTPALRRLIDEAHARGIRVVLDGVFNHASRGFFQFHDILENGDDSAYLDWFSIHGFPLNAYEGGKALGYKAWWNLPALPKFNTDTPAVREFLWGIGRHWIDFGIDGWRLDVANEIDDDDFWREFRRRVHAGNPEAYIVGEVWSEARRWLRGDMWDAVMNYLFTRAAIAFFIGEAVDRDELARTSFRDLDPTGAPAFRRAIEAVLGLYHPNINAAQLNLLDSHDMPRFLTLARGDTSALRLATLFQMTYPGAPSIYYGDEIGLTGGHDPLNRGAFPWDDGDSWDRELLHDFQRFIALRKAHPALRRGSFAFLAAEGDAIAYARRLGSETVLVAINTSSNSRRIDVPVPEVLAEGDALVEVWSRGSIKVEGGRIRGLSLAPRSGRVFATPARP